VTHRAGFKNGAGRSGLLGSVAVMSQGNKNVISIGRIACSGSSKRCSSLASEQEKPLRFNFLVDGENRPWLASLPGTNASDDLAGPLSLGKPSIQSNRSIACDGAFAGGVVRTKVCSRSCKQLLYANTCQASRPVFKLTHSAVVAASNKVGR
jgi:hypothetical protein